MLSFQVESARDFGPYPEKADPNSIFLFLMGKHFFKKQQLGILNFAMKS
jgi:hypothetical protein